MVTHSATATPEVANPNTNIPPNPNFSSVCNGAIDDNSVTCDQTVIKAINNARKSQGIGPLPLPLSVLLGYNSQEQTFVITNLERVARGIPAAVALTSQLDGVAQGGAALRTDPAIPYCNKSVTTGCFLTGNVPIYGVVTSNQATGSDNPLGADYYYMYDDGAGGPNTDCAALGTCWEHRNNILSQQIYCSGAFYMGAGFAPSDNANSPNPSFASILTPGCGIPTDEIFGWPEALRQINGEPALNGPQVLRAGQYLNPGKYLMSSQKNYQLIYQSDGNVVEYNIGGQAVWNSGTGGRASGHLSMQTDGNLVAYSRTNQAYWQSGTGGTGNGNHVLMQNDGNLVIYNSSGAAIWDAASGRL